ncbi:glucosylceramidase-like isoform X2 [Zootermopsis nevadensis]|nr:glucosylceramidase-like isoform X2 [Zootermopsis nevadensis]XP_021925905.1 glucosylceramidase-like isoform X2 [Zootermopsis nevadensis]
MGRREETCKMHCAVVLRLLLIFLPAMVCGQGCAPKNYGTNKVVCVCNATYCDNLHPPEELLQPGYYLQYTSTQTGKRLVPISMQMSKKAPSTGDVWKVTSSKQYQEIIGFGAAITDSVGINIGSLEKDVRESLLNQYYGPEGIGYTLVRVPLGGTDFSTRFYTYDDGTADPTLSRFKLADEDYKYKLPYLKYIKQLSNPRVVTVPWSPPEWMIEGRNGTEGFTRLKDIYYQVYAEYFVNFLNAYQKEGINFWGLTLQNEPGNGYYVYFGINSCGYSPEEQRNFIANNLGPTLQKNNFGNIVIMAGDDQRTFLPESAQVVLDNPAASKFVSGTAVHWYFDDQYPASRLTKLHDLFPDKFILYTEASFIPDSGSPAVLFGDWGRAERLSKDILDVLNHWVTGWIDWNLALNTIGGPTYLNNNLDSPIIVNSTANEFYKQPIFYSLAHLSKFVPPGSKRIQLNSTAESGVDNVAFLRPDNIVAVVLLNSKDDAKKISLQTDAGSYISITVAAHSLNTIIYNKT